MQILHKFDVLVMIHHSFFYSSIRALDTGTDVQVVQQSLESSIGFILLEPS